MANPISARDHRVLGVELTIDRILEFAGNPAISSVSRRFQVYNERLLRNKWQQVATRIESLPILNGYLLALPSLPRNPSKRFETLNETLTKYIEPEILEALNFKNRRLDENLYVELEQRLKDLSLQRGWRSIRGAITLFQDWQNPGLIIRPPNLPSQQEASVDVIRAYLNAPANAGWLAPVTFISFMSFNKRKIYTIPEELKKFTGLFTLILRDNKIRSIAPNSFEGLTQLEWICFQNNHIAYLPGKIFQDLTGWRSISLDNNEIRELPQEAIQGLQPTPRGYLNLQRSLWLTDNPIQLRNEALITAPLHQRMQNTHSRILATVYKILILFELWVRNLWSDLVLRFQTRQLVLIRLNNYIQGHFRAMRARLFGP